MTFKTDTGEGVFHCDECSEHIECDGRTDFKGSFIYAKEKGWRSYIGPDKKFAHACPSCVEDFGKRQRQ